MAKPQITRRRVFTGVAAGVGFGVADRVKGQSRRFQAPAFNKALAECKADASLSAIENTTSGHLIMIVEPDWLADVLVKAA